MTDEWFRKSSWGLHDREDFYKRLKRARPDNQAQYLRIQATYLVGNADTLPAGLALLDEMLERHPDSLEVATALGQKAECLMALGDINGALENYWRSIERMRSVPKMQCLAWLDFALLVARVRKVDRYDDALQVLDEFATNALLFPVDRFKLHASRALIADDRHQPDASVDAIAALDAAGRVTSGLRYHPNIGLVGGDYPALRKRLTALAKGAN
jgi:hypothetical protein